MQDIYNNVNTFSADRRIQFIKKYYQVSKALDSLKEAPKKPDRMRESVAVQDFVRSLLRPDGVFVLRLVAANAGDVIATEIVKQLFAGYVEERNNEKIGNGDDDGDRDDKKLLPKTMA